MLLEHKEFFIREHVSFMKLVDRYDILDPQTQQPIGVAKEEPPEWAKYLRIILNKSMLPTTINVYENENEPPLFSIHKPFTLFQSKVTIVDRNGTSLGWFKGKFFSLGGGFWVHNAQDQCVAEIKGDWKGWDFKFLSSKGEEIGRVTKKWAGIGKELFTSADNYMISLSHIPEGQQAAAILLLAAGLAIDTVYKESS
jgi:uncharacterized protein YxjI